jgi:hypothetical protein
MTCFLRSLITSLGHAAALQCRLDDASRANAKCAAYVSPLEEKIVDFQAGAHTRVLETESDNREEIVVSIALLARVWRNRETQLGSKRRDGLDHTATSYADWWSWRKQRRGAREREMGLVVR